MKFGSLYQLRYWGNDIQLNVIAGHKEKRKKKEEKEKKKRKRKGMMSDMLVDMCRCEI